MKNNFFDVGFIILLIFYFVMLSFLANLGLEISLALSSLISLILFAFSGKSKVSNLYRYFRLFVAGLITFTLYLFYLLYDIRVNLPIFLILISLCATSVFLISSPLFKSKPEIFCLFTLCALGGIFMAKSSSFLGMYLGLELQSLPFYAIIMLRNKQEKYTLSTESSLKYFVLGALSSCLMLYGLSLIYSNLAFSGFDMSFDGLKNYLNTSIPTLPLKIGIVLVVLALLFKVSAFPMYFWAPDVYSSAGSVVLSFVVNIPKISAFYVLYRLNLTLGSFGVAIKTMLLVCAVISIIIGAVGAIKQTNIKRILAYSGILNSGFILLGITSPDIKVMLNYLVIYVVLNIGVFACLCIISLDNIDSENNQNLSNIYKKRPLLALCFSSILLSLAGIPPFAGFFAKFYIITELVASGYYLTATLAVLASVVACFYYLNLIKIMYFAKDEPLDLSMKIFTTANILPYLVLSAVFLLNILMIIRPSFLI